MEKNYTIGLDIGTNSVGWAVVKDDLTLVRRKMKVEGNSDKKYIKKNFWGSLLFEEGQPAEVTRIKRTTRRRYTRRRNRILDLQKFFEKDINKVDENFFRRLDESFLVESEKNSKHPLFPTEKEEKDYYEKFPTIYHLRKYLSDNKEKVDIRLIYLALAHIIKYRGNFLIEGDIDASNTSIIETFKTFLDIFNEKFDNEEDLVINENDILNLEKTFKEKVSRTRKLENVLKYFNGRKKNDFFGLLLTLIVGNQVNFKKIFELDEDIKIKFTDENYEEDLNNLIEIISDEYTELFYSAKAVYNAIELSSFLNSNDKNTNAKLSSQMIKMYEDHREQLSKYKKFVKENLPDKYNEIFKDSTKNGYAGYIEGSTSQENFYKYVKSQIKGTEEEKYFLDLIDKETFLRKQRSFYNGVIPYQIHLKEMEAIINNQKKFYPFLEKMKIK